MLTVFLGTVSEDAALLQSFPLDVIRHNSISALKNCKQFGCLGCKYTWGQIPEEVLFLGL